MKIICIYHSRDLDGWMSAAIVKKKIIDSKKPLIIRNSDKNEGWVEFNVPRIEEKEISESEIDRLVFLGWDYGDSIPDLSEYDKIIMADISLPKPVMLELATVGKLTWIDHHISAIRENSALIDVVQCEGNESQIRLNPKFAACELTWQYFFTEEQMPEIVRLLGRYDCFGHKGTEEEQKVLEFQYAARAYVSNYEEAYNLLWDWSIDTENNMLRVGEGIYQYLCTEAKQTYKKAFSIELLEDNNTEDETCLCYTRKFLCVNQERFNPINFGIDYHKEGYDGFACFWYKENKWMFSLYNDNGNVDCSVIAKQYGGGGHFGASGFVIEDLKQIIK